MISKYKFANRSPKETSHRYARLCLPLLVRRPFRRFAWQKMDGILAIRKRWPSLTQSTRAGEIALSFQMDGRRSFNL